MTQLLMKARDWINSAQLEPTTLTRYAYSLGALARGGVTTLEQVRRPAIRRFILGRLQEGVAPATVNRDVAALCSFLGWLEQLEEFPLEELRKIRTLFLEVEPPPPPDFLTPDQFRRLLCFADTIAPELRLAVAIGVHTGLRFEELRTLWRSDFVLDAEDAYVKVQRTHGRRIKTSQERTAPIARDFADELRLRGFEGDDQPVFPRARLRRFGDAPLSPYLSPSTLQSWHRTAADRSLIQCNWITLRHTYASWLVQSGVSIVKVAKFLGNGIFVCFRHYGALVPGGEKGFAGLKALLSSESQ